MAAEEIMDLASVLNEPADTPEIDDSSDIDDTDVDTDTDSDVDPDVEGDESSEDVEGDGTEKPLVDGKVVKGSKDKVDLSKTDFNKLPENYKKLFTKDPVLKGMYLQNREYSKVFESPKQAHEIAETLEGFGGIDAVKTDLQEIATMDMMFNSGDPAVIDHWMSTNPEAFSKIMPDAIAKFSNSDREGWNHVSSKVIANYLGDNGIVESLAKLANHLGPDSDGAKYLDSLYQQYIDPVIQMSKQQPTKKVDPEKQKLQAEKEAFEKQKSDAFADEVTTSVNQMIFSTRDTELARYTKGKNLSKDQKQLLHENISDRFIKLLKKEPNFNEQFANIFGTHDKAKYTKFMQGKLNKLMPKAVEQIWRGFSGGIAAKSSVPKVKAGENKVYRVNEFPSKDQIDRVKTEEYARKLGMTGNDLIIKKGMAVLKNGKIIEAVG